MNKFTYINHDTWEAERNNGIGASEIPILCGASQFMTPLELWEIKTGKVKNKEVDEKLQQLFDTGHYQEPITLHRFLKQRNVEDADKILLHHVKGKPLGKKSNIQLFTRFNYNDFMFCHPDMVFNDVNVEAKYVRYNHDFDFDKNDHNSIPFKYYLQVQYQLMCTGLKKAILCVNHQGDDHYEYIIDANESLFGKFEKMCFDFWRLVEKKEPPSPKTINDTIKLFPDKNLKAVTISGDIEIQTIVAKDRYRTLKKRIGKLQKEADSIKTSVMMLMTNNNIIQSSNGEQIAKISISESERIAALSKIKKEHEDVYNLLVSKDLINKSTTTRLYL